MKLLDINRESLGKVSNEELLNIHLRLHQLWGSVEAVTDNERKRTLSELYTEKHQLVVDELLKRGLNHNPHDTLDEKSLSKSLYDSHYFDSLKTLNTTFAVDLASVVEFLKGFDILEVGCGNGRNLSVLKNSGYEVTGLDSSSIAVEICKGLDLNVLEGEAEKLLFDDNSFDTVFSTHLLEHLTNPIEAVKESLRVAKNRAVHLVPLGVRQDGTHKHIYNKVKDFIDIFKEVPYTKRFFTNINNCAVVVIDKNSSIPFTMQDFTDFSLIPDYISIVGGQVKSSNPNDIDIVIREEHRNESVEVALINALGKDQRDKLHFIYNLTGPHDSYIPLYDLVARARTSEIHFVNKQSLKPVQFFTPPKTGAGYSMQEFYDIEDFYDKWAKYYVDKGISLDVEQKFNGWRTIVEKEGNDTLLFFEDTKKDRSKQFPDLIEELKMIPEGVILDCDLGALTPEGTPIARKDLAVWSGDKEIPRVFDIGGLKGTLVCKIFDIPYWGEDLHELTWNERRAKLEDLFGKYDFKILQLSPKKIVNSKNELTRAVEQVSGLMGSEGAVIKATDSKYSLTGQITGWAKVKNIVEIKVEVLDRTPVKGTSDVWNYKVGYLYEGKTIPLTQTMNSKINADKGSILTLSVEEVIPSYEEATKGWKVSVVIPRVRDIDVSRKTPYTNKEIIERGWKGNILQVSPEILRRLYSDKLIKQEAKLTIKEGDEGDGVLQVHERGLDEIQIKYTDFFGVDPVTLTDKQVKVLNTIKQGSWMRLVETANSTGISNLLRGLSKEDIDKLTEEQKRVLALVLPVSIHTDIRLHPKGQDYWEGGEGFTPGNQFKENKFVTQKPDEKIMGDFKGSRVGEKKEPTVRGPLMWLDLGKDKPIVFSPGEVGATTNSYGRLKNIDTFKWKAGVQEPHYKEFLFDGKLLNGRWIFTYVPVPAGWTTAGGESRVWMISKPRKQNMDSEIFKAEKKEKMGTFIPFIKGTKKQEVFGIVYEPQVEDSQGDFASAEEIEYACHRFLEDYNLISYMHQEITKRVKVIENYIAPVDCVIGTQPVKKGSWVLGVHIEDPEIWKQVESGELTGFSMEGVARKEEAVNG